MIMSKYRDLADSGSTFSLHGYRGGGASSPERSPETTGKTPGRLEMTDPDRISPNPSGASRRGDEGGAAELGSGRSRAALGGGGAGRPGSGD